MATGESEAKIPSERFAPHLSEFYPLVNNSTQKAQHMNTSQIESPVPVDRLQSPLRSTANSSVFRIRRPSSLRSGFSSINDLQNLVTNKDMTQTVDTMCQLLNNAESYAEELVATSQRASLLALSLEQMARLKGCNDDTADKFLSSSGLFHLIANHQRIMSDCIKSSLIESLTSRIDEFQYKRRVHESRFRKEYNDEAKKLKLQEKYNAQFSKRKTRNLVSYRENLANLQLQLDELESLKHHYYQDSYEMVESCCFEVLKDTATVSRAQVEISENIARKGWSGGGLDELLVNADDPFNSTSGKSNEEQDDYEHNSDNLNSPESPLVSRNGTPLTAKHKSTPIRNSVDAGSSTSVPTTNYSGDNDAYDNSFSLPIPPSQNSSRLQDKEDSDTEGQDELDDNNSGGDNKKILSGLEDLHLDNTNSSSVAG
ncbi:LANO_0E10902g1_1 [Lachancea nothofagi CBS 11611]|uniref:LANO_0E10902g1_1 n=1 Tax=Lachancea nothofagi CBS 11611 TaxID=1266666 RepID=A0A1G4JX73_9SACH|nr:LANO_0E10902g1_1 [Lachancea nothofagi CBS 11611]